MSPLWRGKLCLRSKWCLQYMYIHKITIFTRFYKFLEAEWTILSDYDVKTLYHFNTNNYVSFEKNNLCFVSKMSAIYLQDLQQVEIIWNWTYQFHLKVNNYVSFEYHCAFFRNIMMYKLQKRGGKQNNKHSS